MYRISKLDGNGKDIFSIGVNDQIVVEAFLEGYFMARIKVYREIV